MHLAVIGAGALGRVYGVRLAQSANWKTTFVVRGSRLTEPEPFVLERVDRSEARLEVVPLRSAVVPADVDLVLVAVRTDQVDSALPLVESNPTLPLALLTPVFPAHFERLRERLGERLIAMMPSVVAYNDHRQVTRHWIPRVATTLIEEQVRVRDIVDALVKGLEHSGIPARLQAGVERINAATTASFIPLVFALDVAGSIDALEKDRALLETALAAAREGSKIAAKLGPVASWANLLVRFLGPTSLRLGVRLAKHRAPEALQFVEVHFGRKIAAQNLLMAKELLALADEHRLPSPAIRRLHDRLDSRTRAAS